MNRMHTKLSKRILSLVLSVLMLAGLIPSALITASAEESPFAYTVPGTVPDYYVTSTEQTDPQLYTYKMKDGNTYYRVHGTVDGADEGFYNAEFDGAPVEPFELLDQDNERNNAFSSGTGSTVEEAFRPDEAFVSELKVTDIRDGTEDFDSDDTPGNDSTDDNKIVRSFDSVTYKMRYVTRLQKQDSVRYFKTGFMYVEFTLPCTMAEAKFDIDSMKWLEEGATQEEINGQVVLKGKRFIRAGDQPSAIPGEGELSAIVKVLGMKNEDEVIPTFTVWMDGNGEAQYKSVEADPVVVSAAPSYNIRLMRNTTLSAMSTFDFANTGNADAANKTAGQVYGRIYGYGVTVELRNENPSKQLKGIELPMGEITFDLNLQAQKTTSGVTTDITGTGTGQIMPLLWDYKASTAATTGTYGRNMVQGSGGRAYFSYGSSPNNSGASFSSCVNGGTWSAAQSGSTISVTVDAYQFLTSAGEYHWPSSNNSGAENSIGGADRGIGMFSAGYFQVVFPHPGEVTDSSSYYLTISDSNMKATSISGKSIDTSVTNGNQVIKNDDSNTTEYVATPLGSFGKANYFSTPSVTIYPYDNNLSSSKQGYGADGWIPYGGTLRLWANISQSANTDAEKIVHAVNVLQKFDDEAMQPAANANGTPASVRYVGSPYMTYKILYAAKPDGTGWDSDSEMNLAVENDLIYFATMAELKAHFASTNPNAVCVAMLAEGREGILASSDNFLAFADMTILPGAEIGKVYQTTNTVRLWLPDAGSQMTHANSSRLSTDPGAAAKYTGQDVLLDGTKAPYGPYVKTAYDENGNVVVGTHSPIGGNSGASVLIVGNEATITKSVDQVSTGSPKQTYEIMIGERRVDYVITPNLQLAGGKGGVGTEPATVTITDTLPKGVSVLPTTKYWYGGTYTPDNSVNGGSLSGGTEIFLEGGQPVDNGDGTVTLTWVIPGVIPGEPMEKIHYSALLGDPSDESKDILKDCSLTSTVTIRADRDGRTLHATHGNVYNNTIDVIRLGSSSLMKMVQTPRVEEGEDVVFTIRHNNIAQEKYTQYNMLDVLPSNDDGRGSEFDGTYTSTVTLDLTKNPSLATSLAVYATAEDVAGETVNTVDKSKFTLVDTAVTSGNTKIYTLPVGTTAYMLRGTLDALDSYTATLTMTPDGNSGGNVYANDATACTADDATDYILAPTVSGIVVMRTIKGLAWYDTNKNGIREAGEPLLSNVKVTLIDEETGLTARDVAGSEVAPVITGANGAYSFSHLAKGSYTVKFEGNPGFAIENYFVTLKNQGSDKTNSKADGVNVSNKLNSAVITNIVLPEKEEVSAYGYISNYNDAGFNGGVPAQLVLNGNKNLTGHRDTASITAGQFKFTIAADSGNDTTGYTGMPTGEISVKAGGSIEFGTMTFLKTGTYKFIISEVNSGVGGYGYDTKPVTVTVVVSYDPSDGTLHINESFTKDNAGASTITFNNTYTLEGTSISLEVAKALSGRELNANEFSFIVKEGAETVATGTNNSSGKVTFTPITYVAADRGVHTYKITEVVPAGNDKLGGVTYDSAKEITVTVNVTDGGVGKLVATPTYPSDVTFRNSYAPAKTALALEVSKALSGRAMNAGEFRFIVKENNIQVAEGTNDINGKVEFSEIEYTSTGNHTYVITEVQDSAGGVVYDVGKQVTVTVAVTDNLTGSLVATPTYPSNVTFNNTYQAAPTTLMLTADKKTTGRDQTAGQFEFAVYDSTNQEVATGTNDANGVVAFSAITFDAAGEYKFTVKETSTDGSGWKMDGKAVPVTVTVVDNLDGTLTATPNYTGKDISFTNAYTVAPTKVSLTGTKTAQGADLANGQFAFAVYDADGKQVATATNTADGKIIFSDIILSSAGTYTFTIKETSKSTGNWSCDGTIHTVTVTATDNGDGTLSTAVAYPEKGVVFTNLYTPPITPPEESGSVTIRISKRLLDEAGVLTGTGKQFAVRLYDKDRNVIKRVIVSANEGEVVIAGLESGTTYYLAEEPGDGFEIVSYEVVGTGTAKTAALGIVLPKIDTGVLDIHIIVTNKVISLIDIPDDEPPLAEPELPEIIEIIDVPTPLSNTPKTGDSSNLWLWIGLMAAGAGVLLVTARRHSKKSKKSA